MKKQKYVNVKGDCVVKILKYQRILESAFTEFHWRRETD